MPIIGTAGHVDHGKSSLVTALTGHNPDRLLEEQQRGMTLDLGFAPLRFPDGIEAGIVDVPGHERFLHNMLAGAAGMELLLLVIAATEGPKPQTFEHLHILDLLNVTRALVVLTKIDLVDASGREAATRLARDAVKNTVAQDAPVLGVSAVTGEGIVELKTAIHDLLVGLPARRPQAPAYLPIDRVFALPGHGTIVTGTLMQGVISTGDTLALQPSGVRVRMKSLQVFGSKVASASGGTRLAVNLPGVGTDQIVRGEALVAVRAFVPARELFVDFTALESARPLLRRRVPVRVHIGSAEILGQLSLGSAPPGDERPVPAHLLLWRPAVFYPGQRVIIRRMSPKDLLGGAVVRSAASPAEDASSADGHHPSLVDAPVGAAEMLGVALAAGLTPLPAATLDARANVAHAAAQPALAWLLEHGSVAVLNKPLEYVSRTALDDAWNRVQPGLREWHERWPWRLGMTAGDVARALGIGEPLTARLLAAWLDDGRVGMRAGFWHLPGFAPTLTPAQRDFFDKAVAVDHESPFLPCSYDGVATRAAQVSADMVEALGSLLSAGALVRVGEGLYRRSQLERARAAIDELMKRQGSATMAQLRDVLGTSRKYALPLMEHFDSTGFTVRDGDLRRLRKTR